MRPVPELSDLNTAKSSTGERDQIQHQDKSQNKIDLLYISFFTFSLRHQVEV